MKQTNHLLGLALAALALLTVSVAGCSHDSAQAPPPGTAGQPGSVGAPTPPPGDPPPNGKFQPIPKHS